MGEDPGKRWLKAELHAHCSLDPVDYRACGHTPEQLISRAAALGYEVLAITCHDLDVWTRELADFAEGLGVTLIPGMEVTVGGKHHVLVYNFRTGPENLDTFEKIRARSREDTLVAAPHSFYPIRSCLRNLLRREIDLFDAIELCGFYAPGIDFNRRARRVAMESGKPLVGNADIHVLWQLDRTYTWIHSEKDVTSIIAAVKEGRIRVESKALSHFEVCKWWAGVLWRQIFPHTPHRGRGDLIRVRGSRFEASEGLPSSRN
jgi:predicted metal-dependent phosphoesterase TrpH